MKIIFKTLFFGIENVDFIEQALKQIDINKVYVNRRKDIRLVSFENINEDLVCGDLQQIHNNNLGCKIKKELDNIIEEDFEENEGLGFNNIFMYSKSKKLLILQDNKMGVGYASFEDILNEEFIFGKAGKTDKILFKPIILNDKFDSIDNFKSFDFSISNFSKIENESFFDINSFQNKLNFTSIKVSVKNENNLNSDFSKKILSFLRDSDFKKNTLKTECLIGGENVELNFLSNKAVIEKEIEQEEQKTLEYKTRKEKIIECYNEFINEIYEN